MANSFQEFLTNNTQIGCVGGEDWQWEATKNATSLDGGCEKCKEMA